jgi:hypothetical protein
MQLFVIEAYGGKINITASKSAKETEKMFCVEWGGNSTYITRLKRDKEYALNIVGEDYSMWGRDSAKLAKEFSSAMKELLLEKETLVSHIKSYISAEITFSASSAKSDKKDKPKKKHCLKIIKHSKV